MPSTPPPPGTTMVIPPAVRFLRTLFQVTVALFGLAPLVVALLHALGYQVDSAQVGLVVGAAVALVVGLQNVLESTGVIPTFGAHPVDTASTGSVELHTVVNNSGDPATAQALADAQQLGAAQILDAIGESRLPPDLWEALKAVPAVPPGEPSPLAQLDDPVVALLTKVSLAAALGDQHHKA